ncbi:MAG: hypothetical protein FJY77_05175, partial [Candidatus Altiarchaeales archaeon]|nr:hypothetical protein [Candidatus Altiarchaeales archaeon]
SMQYKGQSVLYQKNSLYGNVVVTKTAGQVNFYQDGIPLFSSENTVSNEESVHYALSQLEAKKVLLVSGGVSGILNEILEHGSPVDYVELDPVLVSSGVRFMPDSGVLSPSVAILESDGRLYVKQSSEKYDAILVNTPDPNTVQLNRYYTKEFFRECRKILSDGGVFSISLAFSENYLSPEARSMHGTLYNTLKSEFKNVLVVPVGRVYYIASDGVLTYDIAGQLERKKIETKYVNENYLKGMLTEERVGNFMDSIQNVGEVNLDLKPVVYSNFLGRVSKQFNVNLEWLYILLLAVMLIAVLKLDSVSLSVYAFGFSGMVLEIVSIVFFQIVYGYVYVKIGVLVTFFMVGLALGAYHTTHSRAGVHANKSMLERYITAMTACSLAIPLISYLVSKTSSNLAANTVFPLFTLSTGFLVGGIFPIACRLHKNKDASKLYALDLFGAFIGSVAASALLIPALGVVGTCLIAAILNFLITLKLKLDRR